MKNTQGVVDVHNARFYNLSPRSINCIAYNSSNGKIALTRNDSTIEIWDITYAPVLEKTICCEAKDNASIEGLAWFGKRLFSGDLAGEIIEYNLRTLTRKRHQYGTGNSIWCIDVNVPQNCLAAGTDEGFLNIFDLSNDDLVYKKLFDKQDGRILCCKFSHNGDYVVTGSLDVIRIWSTKTGSAIRKMSTGRTEKKKETIVWAIQVLQDFTIISGDSRGQFIVWDGNTGIQIESHQVFEKDILTMAVTDAEDILICAGVEAIIRVYCLTPITKNNQTLKKWIKYLQRPVHDHDVKTVTFAGLKILSGGVDGFLGFSSFSKMYQEIKKYGPFLQNPCVCVAEKIKHILLRYPTYLEIWKLGNSEQNTAQKLLELKSNNEDFIVSSAISPNGNWLVYSTTSAIRVFSLKYENDSLQISKYKAPLSSEFSPSRKILFSDSCNKLFLFKEINIDIFNISTSGISFDEKINYKHIREMVHIALLSKDEQFLVVGSTCKKINVWHKNEGKYKHYVTLPKYAAPITAIQIHPLLPKLIAVFSDGYVVEYDLQKKKFINSDMLYDTDFTMDPIKNILYENEGEKILLQSENKLITCEWSNELEEREKRSKIDALDIKNSLKLNSTRLYDNLIETKWLSQNEIVIVGVNPVSLIEVLPNPFRRKLFGVS